MIGTSYSGMRTITIRIKSGHIEYCCNETAFDDADDHVMLFGVTELADGGELIITRKNGLLELQERAFGQP